MTPDAKEFMDEMAKGLAMAHRDLGQILEDPTALGRLTVRGFQLVKIQDFLWDGEPMMIEVTIRKRNL